MNTMKVLFLSSLLVSASAFVVPRSPVSSMLFATVDVSEETTTATDASVSVDASAASARAELLELANDLKGQYGVLLIDSNAKESFRKAVEQLESVAEVPTDVAALVGDWTLVCSSSSSSTTEKLKIDTSKIPFFNEGPVRDIKNTLNDSIEVLQTIKFGEASNSIDAIDHVIKYSPPNQLTSFLKNIPDAIKDLDINPLKVSDTKVVLKHKAEVEGVIPVIKTKLSLQSVVVNVAGESKNLEPTGADVLGINIPFGELLNAGSFETTFLDDSMRVSRSKTGPVDQLRVFVKAETKKKDTIATSSDDEIDIDDDDEIVDDDDELAIDAEVIDDDDDDEIIGDAAPSDVEIEQESPPSNEDNNNDDEIIGDAAPSDVEN